MHLSDDEPIKVGAIFQVTTSTSLSDVVLDYETIELERPHKIVLRGENGSMVSIDTITIKDRADGGADVTYDAAIELKGLRKLADPVMQVGLKRLGDKARHGLTEKLQTSQD